jgi:hypothetical protein
MYKHLLLYKTASEKLNFEIAIKLLVNPQVIHGS